MKFIDISKVVNKRSAFIMKDTTVVTIIVKIENTYFLNINLKNKNNYYYNFFIRELELVDRDYYLKELFIKHPPFRFHSKDILVNKSLDIFWNNVIESLYDKNKSTNINPKYNITNEEQEGIYFKCFKILPENHKMSEKAKNKLLNIIDKDKVDYIIKSKQTAVFTNDITKAKSLKIAIK